MFSDIENEKIELIKLMKKYTDKSSLKMLKKVEILNASKSRNTYAVFSEVE